uniref:Transmembrane protein 54b n=1 Tax=Gadus morhua TaxID=8049 RepID=A0A8C5CDY3_GADMO
MGTRMHCASLEDPNALMRMGLSVILIGHVNFLLGALVHGAVLRHINLHKQARAMEYSISNVMALSAGLAIIVGILAIILSKNKSDRKLTWALFALSLLSSLMGAAAAVGLLLSVVRAIVHGGRSLLTHCRFPDAIGYSSITNECPFDPTRIYVSVFLETIIKCSQHYVVESRLVASTHSCPPPSLPPPEHHSHPLGAPHRHVPGPAGVLLPVLRRLHLLPGPDLLPRTPSRPPPGGEACTHAHVHVRTRTVCGCRTHTRDVWVETQTHCLCRTRSRSR